MLAWKRISLSTLSVAYHAVLLLLAKLRCRELGLLLRTFNLVTHGIELLFLLTLLGQPGAGALTLNPVVTGGSHLTVNDGPDFTGDTLRDVLV